MSDLKPRHSKTTSFVKSGSAGLELNISDIQENMLVSF